MYVYSKPAQANTHGEMLHRVTPVRLSCIPGSEATLEAATNSLALLPPSQITSQMSEVGPTIRTSLTTAIESWRTGDRDPALSVRPQEAAIRAECGNLHESLSQFMAAPGEGAAYVDLMLIAGIWNVFCGTRYAWPTRRPMPCRCAANHLNSAKGAMHATCSRFARSASARIRLQIR